MKYVGVDLHKHVIVLCVVVLEGGRPKAVTRRRFGRQETATIRAFFAGLGPFQMVAEATAAYEWLFGLLEDLAERLVLAHPKKLRVIAESTRKSDKIDAEVLGVFLALDMIPEAYRPTPRVRQHRVLVRYRCWLQRRISSLKAKIRNVPGVVDQQGRLSAVAVGVDPGRLAVGGAFAPMADPVRASPAEHRFEEEGDRGHREAAVVRDDGHAPVEPVLSAPGTRREASDGEAQGEAFLRSGSAEGARGRT